jgi:DNA excision repair protein ERCC-4
VSRPVAIIDTREQKPYAFPSGRLAMVRRALPAGDYSLEGLEGALAVERKSLADFVNTVIGDRDRWKAELAKLTGYRCAAVVVEACMHDVLAGGWHGGALPSSVLAASLAVTVDYRVPVIWAGDRATAERVTEGLLLRAAFSLVGEGK